MASQKALSPPPGECTQCWFHAYAREEAHAGLRSGEDCPACMSHLHNGHGNMIVPGSRRWF